MLQRQDILRRAHVGIERGSSISVRPSREAIDTLLEDADRLGIRLASSVATPRIYVADEQAMPADWREHVRAEWSGT